MKSSSDLPGREDLHCREIHTEQGFARLRPAWEDLFRRSAFPTPFCTWEWAWHWWQRLAAPDPLDYELRIVAVFAQDETLLGLAPFYYPTRAGGRLRPLRLLGTRIRCGQEDMTDEPIFLRRAGWEEPVLRAVLRHLAGQRDAPWDLVHVRVMRRADAPSLSAAWQAVRRTAPLLQAHLRVREGQTVTLPQSWPEFRRSLSKSMRDNLSYYPRLLTRHGHDWNIRTARTPAEVTGAAEILIRLHHARAQSAVGTAHRDHLPTAAQERFLADSLRALAESGRASILLLEVGGRAAAAQAVLEAGGLLLFYYSGFEAEWAAYSPITILNAHALESAIARGLTLADYLPTEEPWKTRWKTGAAYVLEEVSWLPLRPRPALRSVRRGMERLWRRFGGGGCDCGFCRLPTERAAPDCLIPAPGTSCSPAA